MNLNEFEDLLDRFGADPEDWPPTLRSEAERLSADSADARSILDAAERVELGLANIAHQAPSYLAARVVANTPRVAPFESLLGWLAASPWRSAVTLLLPLALGFGAGVYAPNETADYAGLDGYVFADTLEELDYDDF